MILHILTFSVPLGCTISPLSIWCLLQSLSTYKMVALSACGLYNIQEEGSCFALNAGGPFAQCSANRVSDFTSQP